MAQPQPDPREDVYKQGKLLTDMDGGELFSPVDINDDLRSAVRRAAESEERLVVRDGDKELVAILPLNDIRFLVQLENAALDQFDLEEARKALADPDNQERIPFSAVRMQQVL